MHRAHLLLRERCGSRESGEGDGEGGLDKHCEGSFRVKKGQGAEVMKASGVGKVSLCREKRAEKACERERWREREEG